MNTITTSIEYRMVEAFYGARETERSRVKLINHINEGLVVLDCINATDEAKRAFCLHPILQADRDLQENYGAIKNTIDGAVMCLAMEYRSTANNYLRERVHESPLPEIKLSPLWEVNDMLIADKVQNRKDFLTYHKDTHPNRDELTVYFSRWLDKLGITEKKYSQLCAEIDTYKRILQQKES